MKIILINCAETEEDFLRNVIGRKNELLNDTGRRQVLSLKNKISNEKFDVCFTSPLIRCFETAIVLFGDKCEIIKEERIIDRDMGELEGCKIDEYNAFQFCDYRRNREDYGIESIHTLVDRCSSFFDYLKEHYKNNVIVIVTHPEVYRVLRHLALGHDINRNLLDGKIEYCLKEEFEIK